MYSLIISFIVANCVLTVFNKDNDDDDDDDDDDVKMTAFCSLPKHLIINDRN